MAPDRDFCCSRQVLEVVSAIEGESHDCGPPCWSELKQLPEVAVVFLVDFDNAPERECEGCDLGEASPGTVLRHTLRVVRDRQAELIVDCCTQGSRSNRAGTLFDDELDDHLAQGGARHVREEAKLAGSVG